MNFDVRLHLVESSGYSFGALGNRSRRTVFRLRGQEPGTTAGIEARFQLFESERDAAVLGLLAPPAIVQSQSELCLRRLQPV